MNPFSDESNTRIDIVRTWIQTYVNKPDATWYLDPLLFFKKYRVDTERPIKHIAFAIQLLEGNIDKGEILEVTYFGDATLMFHMTGEHEIYEAFVLNRENRSYRNYVSYYFKHSMDGRPTCNTTAQ